MAGLQKQYIKAADGDFKKAWRLQKAAMGSGGGGGSRRRRSSETIVPDDSGDGVTTRGGAHLRASYGGHVVVVFDGPALAATLSGFIERLLNGQNVNLAVLFPQLYPDQAAVARSRREYAQEYQIGAEMVQYLPAALTAYGITPEQWGSWYVMAKENAPPLPAPGPLQGQLAGNQVNPRALPGAFGSPLPGPLVVTGPFGQQR